MRCIDSITQIALRPCITKKDPYTFINFYKYYSTTVFESEDAIDETFYTDMNRVLARVLQDGCFYIKKDNLKDRLFNKIDNFNKKLDFDIRYKEVTELPKKRGHATADVSVEIKTKSGLEMILNAKTRMNTYSVYTCDPTNNSEDVFNSWAGFTANLVLDTSKPMVAWPDGQLRHPPMVDMNLVQPVLDFYRNAWCDTGDKAETDALLHYLMSLFAFYVQSPGEASGIAIFLYGKQGTCKNFLVNFLLEHVLGRDTSYEVSGIDRVVQKHNKLLEGRRVIVVNELASTKDEFRPNFDKVKNYISDKVLDIEPKNIDQYQIPNISNWIFISNHMDSMYLEEDDRRYVCLETTDYYKGKYDIINEFAKKYKNQTVGNHFFTYLMSYRGCNIKKIPNTKLKKEIKRISQSSIDAFMDIMEEELQLESKERLTEWADVGKEIGSNVLYQMYSSYCGSNGLKAVSNTKFGIRMNQKYDRRKSHGQNLYILKN